MWLGNETKHGVAYWVERRAASSPRRIEGPERGPLRNLTGALVLMALAGLGPGVATGCGGDEGDDVGDGEAGGAAAAGGAEAGTVVAGNSASGGSEASGGSGADAPVRGGAGGSPFEEVVTVDPDATAETKAVFARLREVASDRVLFGMQNASTQGVFQVDAEGNVDWGADDGVKSDVRTICGAGPAVYGFDVAGVVGDWWLSRPEDERQRLMHKARDKQVEHARLIWSRGGIVTFSWHAANPITNEGFRDGPRELWRIVPPEKCAEVEAAAPDLADCGSHWDVFQPKIDMLVAHFKNLKTEEGTAIPIIWRPFHENSGGWFWWGAKKDADAQYQVVFRAIWSWMVEYFQENDVHNLLWSISPNGHGGWSPMDQEKYLSYTPGLELVDVLGYDFYGGDFNRQQDPTWGSAVLDELGIVVELARENDKVAAFTEGGATNGLADGYSCDFWSGYTLGPVLDDPTASGIAYFLTWYNHPTSKGSQWGPVPGHCSADDFRTMCESSAVLLEGDIDW